MAGTEARPTSATRPYKYLRFICFYRKPKAVSNPREANQNPNLSTPYDDDKIHVLRGRD